MDFIKPNRLRVYSSVRCFGVVKHCEKGPKKNEEHSVIYRGIYFKWEVYIQDSLRINIYILFFFSQSPARQVWYSHFWLGPIISAAEPAQKGGSTNGALLQTHTAPRATSSTQALPDDATPQAEAPGGELQLPYIPYANIRGGYEPSPKRVSYIFIPIYHYGDGGHFRERGGSVTYPGGAPLPADACRRSTGVLKAG